MSEEKQFTDLSDLRDFLVAIQNLTIKFEDKDIPTPLMVEALSLEGHVMLAIGDAFNPLEIEERIAAAWRTIKGRTNGRVM